MSINLATKKYRFDLAVDLTQELANGMPVYPGDPQPSFERAKTIAKNGVNISDLKLGSHTGTHVDAPLHFVEGGKSVDQLPVNQLIGEALVVDFSFKKMGEGITASDLKKALDEKELNDGEIIICFTGCSDHWGDPKVNSNFTYLTGEGAKYLVSRKVRAVGIDFLSIEQFHSSTHETHKELLRNGVFIVESLSKDLKRFLGEWILFMALPIKFKDGDGAPCRAVAVPITST